MQSIRRGKPNNDAAGKEDTRGRVALLVKKLQNAQQCVEELVEIHRQYGATYDRDKAYADDIDFER